MITDIFIKSYRKDFRWLQFCLRSISKFVTGIRDVHIVVPEQDLADIQTWGLTREKIHSVREYGRGYNFQQVVKMKADTYTDAEHILFLDSDCCFTGPFFPDLMFKQSRIILLITPYTEMPADFPWQGPTEKALGFPCKYETMRRLPLLYPRDVIKACREYVEKKQDTDIEDYIMSQPAFSEFNVLGSYAYEKARDDFYVVDTSRDPFKNLPVKQNWSHTEKWDQARTELESILV